MGYKKGQSFAGLGLVFLIILALLFIKIVIIAVLTLIAILVISDKRGSKDRRDRALVVLSILFLLLASVLIFGEAFPEIIDAPAAQFPELANDICALHWLFPVHLFELRADSTVIDRCEFGSTLTLNERAIANADPSLCSPTRSCALSDSIARLFAPCGKDCVHEAVMAGGTDCFGVQDEEMRGFCYLTLAKKTGDLSHCEQYSTSPVGCITYSLGTNLDCEDLTDDTFKNFCEEAKNAFQQGNCGKTLWIGRYPIDPISCIAIRSNSQSFCEFSHYWRSCTEILSKESGNSSICQKIGCNVSKYQANESQ